MTRLVTITVAAIIIVGAILQIIADMPAILNH